MELPDLVYRPKPKSMNEGDVAPSLTSSSPLPQSTTSKNTTQSKESLMMKFDVRFPFHSKRKSAGGCHGSAPTPSLSLPTGSDNSNEEPSTKKTKWHDQKEDARQDKNQNSNNNHAGPEWKEAKNDQSHPDLGEVMFKK
jgi:hypothetical protein